MIISTWPICFCFFASLLLADNSTLTSSTLGAFSSQTSDTRSSPSSTLPADFDKLREQAKNDSRVPFYWHPSMSGNPYPNNYNRTRDEIEAELKDICMLWDPSCTGGNRTAAAEKFLKFNGTREYLMSDPQLECWDNSTNCAPAVTPQLSKIKDWMRTQECRNYREKFGSLMFDEIAHDKTCCAGCRITAGNVEVYYWPVSD